MTITFRNCTHAKLTKNAKRERMKDEREPGKQPVCLVVLLIRQKFLEGRDCLLHSVVLQSQGKYVKRRYGPSLRVWSIPWMVWSREERNKLE